MRIVSILNGWLQCHRGNVATVVALSAIPLLAAITGVVELQGIADAKSRLQVAVDAGALAGAQRLGIVDINAGDDADTTAENTANSDLRDAFPNSPVSYTVIIDRSKGSLKLDGTLQHKALIGFLGFGDRTITASATADALGSVPLCVLQTGSDKKDSGIQVKDNASIRAYGCAVQANKDIQVDAGGFVQAAQVEAAGKVSGPVSPAGYSGALAIADPFASMDLVPPTVCDDKPVTYKLVAYTTLTLAPGVHCEHFDIDTGATLHLLPGDHYFMDDLNAHNNAVIEGDDVVLIFGSTKKVNFFDHSSVRLTARKTGQFAGFLIITTRNNIQQFSIMSNNVSELLGTIYIPNAQLIIDTSGNVAQDSAWSIIVADTLQLHHNPHLVINTNYIGSGVPVPDGVGPSKEATLVR